MAGRLAHQLGARNLLLTHFSQRYYPSNYRVMRAFEERAAKTAGLPIERVAASYDTLSIPIWQSDRQKAMLPQQRSPPRAPESPEESGLAWLREQELYMEEGDTSEIHAEVHVEAGIR